MAESKIPQLPVDYVTRDYEGYFDMMKDSIPVLTPEWTDTSENDQGIVILQALSYALHTLSYYQERTMQEAILETARTKTGILAGCSFLGYSPKRQSASVVTLKMTKEEDYLDTEVIIPNGTKFSTNPEIDIPIIFETLEPLIIPEGELTGEVTARQGETIEAEVVGNSDGNANQKITLDYEDVLEDSIYVYTYENNTIKVWEAVDNFLNSTPTDRHFTTEIDEEDRTILVFGDGVLGRIPTEEDSIYASYRIGGGTIGNLAPTLINNIYDDEADLDFLASVTNEEWASGGEDYEDLNEAKKLAPKHFRSRGQAVTPTDFEDIASLTEGVALAKCVETFKTDLYIYILDTTYNGGSEALCELVAERINSNRVGNVRVIVEPCNVEEFNISIKVFVHDNFDEDTVFAEVADNLREAFDVNYFTFGTEFYASKVIDVAFNTAGVKNVVIDTEVTKDILDVDDITVLKLNEVLVGGK